MARVLCVSSFPAQRVREALGRSDLVVESGVPPWSGDDVVALLAFEAVSVVELAQLPSLRVVATPSVGFDHIAVDAATERGVWVCNVPDYCVEEMADHALALLLALARGVVALDRSVAGGDWDYRAAGVLQRISDLRLGVIGFGRIGRALAARGSALGMEVSAFDPFLADDEIAAAGVRPRPLEDLLATSTAISLHAPLTEATRGLIGQAELELLPLGALVVNAARAPLLDARAALAALESGHLGGLALDVLDVEPPTPEAKAPSSPRLVVTPHAGWYSEQAEETVFWRTVESVAEALAGDTPKSAVNAPVRR